MKSMKIMGVNYESIIEFKGSSPCEQCDLQKQCDIDELTVSFCFALIGDEGYWKNTIKKDKEATNERN